MGRQEMDMPNGWSFLTGDRDWQGVGATWYKKAADGSFYLVKFWNFCEYDPQAVERGEVDEFNADVHRINISEVPGEDLASALRSCGWKFDGDAIVQEHNGELVEDDPERVQLLMVDALDSYGLHCPMWSGTSSKYAIRLRAEARRQADAMLKDADYEESLLNRPVNALGSTAREFGSGDVYAALGRYVSEPQDGADPAKDITLKILTGKTREEIRAEHYKAGPADCPFTIFMPEHYQFGEKCGCYNKEHREQVMMQPTRKGGWGYTAATFKRKGIEV